MVGQFVEIRNVADLRHFLCALRNLEGEIIGRDFAACLPGSHIDRIGRPSPYLGTGHHIAACIKGRTQSQTPAQSTKSKPKKKS